VALFRPRFHDFLKRVSADHILHGYFVSSVVEYSLTMPLGDLYQDSSEKASSHAARVVNTVDIGNDDLANRAATQIFQAFIHQ
jgi:hypothetical protein